MQCCFKKQKQRLDKRNMTSTYVGTRKYIHVRKRTHVHVHVCTFIRTRTRTYVRKHLLMLKSMRRAMRRAIRWAMLKAMLMMTMREKPVNTMRFSFFLPPVEVYWGRVSPADFPSRLPSRLHAAWLPFLSLINNVLMLLCNRILEHYNVAISQLRKMWCRIAT